MQVIVSGLELPPQWQPPVHPAYKVDKPALKQLQQKIRELGGAVLGAEAAARAKAAIQIKELQDMVQRLESEVSSLGQQLDEQEDRFEKQRQSLTVCSSSLSWKCNRAGNVQMQGCWSCCPSI